MRLAGQTKNGFFPAPPEAIAAVLKHLELPPDPPPDATSRICILDPCAGEAKALAAIHQGLTFSMPGDMIVPHAIELNAGRADRIREAYPTIRLLGPCSFHAAQIQRHTFGLIYLNPPFDDEFGGGGREENSFLERAAWLLKPGGILVFVLPYNQVFGNSKTLDLLDGYFEKTEVFLFPDGHRPFREACVIGRRRGQSLPSRMISQHGILTGRGFAYRFARDDSQVRDIPRLGDTCYEHWALGQPVQLSRRDEITTWTIPWSWPTRIWAKTELTSEEIELELARSPLYDRLATRTLSRMRRPPLPLNRGHTSLTLLAGLLDGYVPSDPPHVVRGYTGKETKLARVEEHTTPNGTHIRKKISTEQPDPVCRAVWADGKIRTFSERRPEETKPTEECVIENEDIETEEDE